MEKEKIYVVGHKNPDTDSICSAIAYANLMKKVTGQHYVPRRAGKLNDETLFVLDKFKVEEPSYLSSVKLQVKDMDIRHIEGVSPDISIKDTWEIMKRDSIKTLPVLEDGELAGVISTGDIAKSYMDVYDNEIIAKAKTSFRNVLNTLNGTLLAGNDHAHITKGKTVIGASDKEAMENFIFKDDIVITGDRYVSKKYALDVDASCIVICRNGTMDSDLLERANEQQITVISTPYDTFTVARLINQSIPIKYFMSDHALVTFDTNEFIDDIKEKITKNKYRDFPVLNRRGQFEGFISRRRLLAVNKKKVVLVDHNEKSQAVDGIEEADIVGIVDHHRIGRIETTLPVFFRNQPLGSTCTIISLMYEEQGIAFDKTIAGLLCCAIISDTLMFRSPTSTEIDEIQCKKLAKIAELDIEKTAISMFKAGSNFSGKSPKEVFLQDFKKFTVNDITFGIGQINVMSNEELIEAKELVQPYLKQGIVDNSLQMIYFMITDIFEESSELLCEGENAREIALDAFDLPEDTGDIILKQVVSRKKQLVPALVGAIEQ
ncbi:MAG: putative manganese-dependent inorganic diphosphatase [Lachnospiraceae bacterium]|jgi:manganese-dependent inorganic pyrophosphatase|nr:putative manganese-dependent inorganic diphosphatase [Lachnospiraceae bacterium]